MKISTFVLSVALASLSPVASAVFHLKDQFDGQFDESFESFQNRFEVFGYRSMRIFNNTATLRTVDNSARIYIIEPSAGAGQGLLSNGQVFPKDGLKAVNWIIDTEIIFDTPVNRFGGFFYTCNPIDNELPAKIWAARDLGNSIVGTIEFLHENGDPTWHGFEDLAGIKKVSFSRFGIPAMDALTYDPVPEPASLIALAGGAFGFLRRRHSAKRTSDLG
jgi:hypothetical protein